MVKKRFLGIVFAVLVLCVLNSVPVYAEEAMDSAAKKRSIEESYQFPLTPEDEKWKTLETTDEMFSAYQIPENILKEMSTKALVQTVLENAFLTQFTVYENSLDAMRVHEEGFNVYPEMQARTDYYEVLAELYNEAHVLTTQEYNSKNVKPEEYFYVKNLEILIAAEIYENEQSTQISIQKACLDSDVVNTNKRIKRERSGETLYSTSSNGFYWFYTMLPENAMISTKDTSLLVTLATSGEIATTVKTPKGTVVVAAILDELDEDEIQAYDYAYSQEYPAATKLHSATNRFNCHSYAWYSQNVQSNKYWIRNPKDFWEDGSYSLTGITLNCKVRYLSGLHSAIVSYYSNGVTYYTSKWGNHGLYYHAPTYGPRYGVTQGVEYYK